jgi:hypothetical protein
MGSGSSASRVFHVCPKHGARLFDYVVDEHKFSVFLKHDGMLVLEVRFLIFGGYLVVFSYGVRLPKKVLSKFELGVDGRSGAQAERSDA